MSIHFETTVYVHGKKYDASLGAGWYSGNEPVLVKVTLFEFVKDFVTVFDFQLIKFSFGLFFTKVN